MSETYYNNQSCCNFQTRVFALASQDNDWDCPDHERVKNLLMNSNWQLVDGAPTSDVKRVRQ